MGLGRIAQLLGCASVLAMTAEAYAGDVTISRGGRGAQINQLFLNTKTPEITSEQTTNKLQEFVYLEGKYNRPGWNLIIGSVKLKRTKTGKFKVKTAITGKRKSITLAAVGPGGQVENETIQILYPSWSPQKASQHSLSVGAGLSLIDYTQTAGLTPEGDRIASAKLSEKAITVKASYLYRFKNPNWDLGFTGFMTAMTFGATATEDDVALSGSNARFIGLNFRAGYTFPKIKEPWRVTLAGGLYYTTMMVNTGNYGFSSLMGPQLFPVIRRTLSKGDSVSGYLKFSPVGAGGFSILSLSSRELAFGLTYSKRLRNGHYMPLSFDYSNLQSEIEQSQIKLTTLNFSVGYTL